MTLLIGVSLAFGVACTWLGVLSALRLPALGRIHAIGFVNVAAGAAFTLAAWLADGATSRTGKALVIWAVLMLGGALSAHVTGRAIHLRSGERR